MKPTIILNDDYYFQWVDADTGCVLTPNKIPPKVRTALALKQIKETPERINALKSFLMLSKMPYHQLFKASLTLHQRHLFCAKKKIEFVYRSDALIDLYRDNKLYAVAHTTGVIVSFV